MLWATVSFLDSRLTCSLFFFFSQTKPAAIAVHDPAQEPDHVTQLLYAVGFSSSSRPYSDVSMDTESPSRTACAPTEPATSPHNRACLDQGIHPEPCYVAPPLSFPSAKKNASRRYGLAMSLLPWHKRQEDEPALALSNPIRFACCKSP